MRAQGITSGYALSRNPIILHHTWPVYADVTEHGTFNVSIDGSRVFEGRFMPPLSVDLSEIADSCTAYFPEPIEDGAVDSVLTIVEDAAELSCRRLHACFEYGGVEADFSCYVIPGGISRQNYRKLVNVGSDIFAERFLKAGCNFFMTTRTSGWLVTIPETELSPLYFLIGEDSRIEIYERCHGFDNDMSAAIVYDKIDMGVYALDVEALRRKFIEEYDVLPSVFDIYRDGQYSCRIIVSEADVRKDGCRVRFRNSLGVFEVMELTGQISVSPDYSASEDAMFGRYDSVIGAFCSSRERVERQQLVSIATGVMCPDRVGFLMDMLGSEEVYLLDVSPDPVRVIPTVERLDYRPRPDAPENFTVKFEVADADLNITQDIAGCDDSMRPRIFSDEYDNKFN